MPAHGESRLTLRFVRQLGAADGPVSLSRVGAMAVSADSILAVVDRGACQAVLIDIPTGGFRGRLGRCGNGPGEFPGSFSIAFRADTLVVLNPAQRTLQFVTRDGVERRRVRLSRRLRGMLEDLITINDSAFGLTVGAMPGQFADTSADGQMLATVRADDGALIASGVKQPAAAETNTFNYGTTVTACRLPSGAEDRIAVMGIWAFDGAVMDASNLKAEQHWIRPLTWTAPRVYQERVPGSLRPGAVATSVVCTGRGPLLWAVRYAWSVKPARPDGGQIDLYSPTGEVLMNYAFTARDTLLFERPLAAAGDRVFFRANENVSHPSVLEFRLERLAAGVDGLPRQ